MNPNQEYPPNDRAKADRYVQRIFYGDAVKDEATALALAEVLIRSSFGEDELRKQQPLTVRADGESWALEGSFNRDRSTVGAGPVIVKLNRVNATVESLYLSLVTPPREA